MGNCELCSKRPMKLQQQRNTKHPVTTISSFTTISHLGKGSFGKVLLVRHKSTGELYALKSIKKSLLADTKKRAQALIERVILSEVNSEFIVKLHYSFQSPSKLFLALDFMQGSDLFLHLRKMKQFPPKIAQFYAAEVLLALEDLHSHDVMYRDLKPENILVGADGHIKLADFNLSAYVSYGDRTICGTMEYIAPEILLNKEQGKEVDMWSFGVFLYELIEGKSPFRNKSNEIAFRNISRANYFLPPRIPCDAGDLIRALLKVNPKERLKDIQEIKRHQFFEGVNWEAMRNKTTQPPLSVKVIDRNDLRYFSGGCVEESSSENGEADMYDNFTFSASPSIKANIS